MTLRRAAFLDRDGVVNLDGGYVYRVADFHFVPGVLQGARRLRALGYALVIVTNQSGIGRGYYSEAQFAELTAWMSRTFAAAGAPLAGIHFCPHHPTDALGRYRVDCDCRKPMPGMLLQTGRELEIDLADSVLFGDRESDLQAALAAGLAHRILLGTDGLAVPSPLTDLSTGCYRSLGEALRDEALLRQLATDTLPA